MTNFFELKNFFESKQYKVIIAADAEPRVHIKQNNKLLENTPAGGVSIALDPIASASSAIYIARGKTIEDFEVIDRSKKIKVISGEEIYTLKRLKFNQEELDEYYNGYANQTIWPLCHVAFEQPNFSHDWFKSYETVNKIFADNIKQELKGKTFIWVNDYQLALVPQMLGRPKNTIVGIFWHIPWPTWEVFRILPTKKKLLEGLLSSDFLAFHRGYHVRNFLNTVERELEVRVEQETGKVFHNGKVTTVKSLPMGIDSDVIQNLLEGIVDKPSVIKKIRTVFGISKSVDDIERIFEKYKVIIGVDRLDYTKGFVLRLKAIDYFFSKYPKYRGKVAYLGIVAPSREKIPAYVRLRKEVKDLEEKINFKYQTKTWKPINLFYKTYTRPELLNFYRKAPLCMVTPRDDGMNLVSKEYIIATSTSSNPGMLILSQFAGSAIDLSEAIIVNPYDIESVAEAIKKGLEMSIDEKKRRVKNMNEVLSEKNVYEWAREFFMNAEQAARENR